MRLWRTFGWLLMTPWAVALWAASIVLSARWHSWVDYPPWYGAVDACIVIFGGIATICLTGATLNELSHVSRWRERWVANGAPAIVARVKDGRVTFYRIGGGPEQRLAAFAPGDEEAALEYAEHERIKLREALDAERQAHSLVRVLNR